MLINIILASLLMGAAQESMIFLNSKDKLTLAEAIQIGKEELIRRTPNSTRFHGELEIKADDDNSAWNQLIKSNPTVLEVEHYKKMHLENKSYWAIYYAPIKKKEYFILGGDAFVFIDRISGDVIDVILFR